MSISFVTKYYEQYHVMCSLAHSFEGLSTQDKGPDVSSFQNPSVIQLAEWRRKKKVLFALFLLEPV